MMAEFPVVDFTQYGLLVADPDSNDDVMRDGLVAEVRSALMSSGFLCLVNHGIKETTVKKLFNTSRTFFELPESIKQKALRTSLHYNHGWSAMHSERLGEGKFNDLSERLSFVQEKATEGWPLDEIPSLREDFEAFHREVSTLALRLLSIISLAVGKEKNYFAKYHENVGKSNNRSLVSCVYYPALPADYNVKDGETRLGAHTDFGSVTLLFTNGIEGLQVWNHDEQAYRSVPHIPGGVIVNIGDAMQRWTADKLISNWHRVTIPASSEVRQRVRQAITFFLHADDDVILTCLDGSDKYPPITMEKHLYNRYKARAVKY